MSGFHTIKQLIALGRLRFLSIGFSLYVLGALLAMLSGAAFSPSRFAFGYVILMLGHLSVHYSNDYFDYASDRLGRSGATSGGSGILVKNPGLLRLSRLLGIGLALASIAGGAIFTIVYAFPVTYLGFAILGNLVSWYYTAPPLRMAYNAYGVLASTFAVGFLMPAIGDFSTYGSFSPLFIVFVLPLSLHALAFLISVQIPDVEADRRAGKRTFVAIFGIRAGFILAVALLACMSAFYLAAALIFINFPIDFRLIALLSLLPLGVSMLGMIKGNKSPEINEKLVKYQVICYVLFTIALDAYLLLALFHPV